MPLKREDNGNWTLEPSASDEVVLKRSHPSYIEALPKYLTALDPAFTRAREASEFNFLLALFAIRGMQDAGWDPYETSVRAIDAVLKLHREMEGEAAQHLALWLYGHVMEASEPYEFLSNLLAIAVGGRFNVARCPERASPQTKIKQIQKESASAGMPEVVVPMQESWNREFRNAIFHADYSLHGSEVRTMRPLRQYSHDQVMTLVNRALAYHEAMRLLRKVHIESYEEPTIIPCDPAFSPDPDNKTVVIVRKGYGAVGLKDGWTADQLRAGRIPYRMGRFTYDEMKLLDADRTLALLPASDASD